MENKKNKNLGLALIAIFISILSIFISILKFNGTNQNNNYLLNGQQTHVAVEPIKHNAFDVRNNFTDIYFYSNSDNFNYYFDYKLTKNISFSINIVQEKLQPYNFDIEYYLYFNDFELLLTSTNKQFNILDYYNEFYFDFSFVQVDNLEFEFVINNFDFNGTYFNYNTTFNFDIPIDYYSEFFSLIDPLEEEFNYQLFALFYLNELYNVNDYNNTLFDNISLIATKVGAILVATLTPITTLLFANGKLTIVGASLAMALGVGAIYLIFRMVRGLIKQNGRG